MLIFFKIFTPKILQHVFVFGGAASKPAKQCLKNTRNLIELKAKGKERYTLKEFRLCNNNVTKTQ